MTAADCDVLCVGNASYDLVFSIPSHPAADEKTFAEDFLGCGGGPAANAAIAIARQNLKAAFAGYLGLDHFGDLHLQELLAAGVDCSDIQRGRSPTPLSAILVKPDGQRALINYKGSTQPLPATISLQHDLSRCRAILFDGHEPDLSASIMAVASTHGIATVLDAGSLHPGTRQLMSQVDYLIASEKFARQYSGQDDPRISLALLSEQAPFACITLGERGLIWKSRATGEATRLPAFPVAAIDTTGAGDIFHGVFSACIARQQTAEAALTTASAAAALGCCRTGARPGIPDITEIAEFMRTRPALHGSAI